MTAKAKFDENGRLIAFFQTTDLIAQYDAGIPAASAFEFDPDTNREIVQGIHRDWNGWTYDGVDLRRRGVIVPVNPPGRRKQLEDSFAADLRALLTNGWDGLTSQRQSRIILRLILAQGHGDWSELRARLRESGEA